jgi:hypothetical protein
MVTGIRKDPGVKRAKSCTRYLQGHRFGEAQHSKVKKSGSRVREKAVANYLTEGDAEPRNIFLATGQGLMLPQKENERVRQIWRWAHRRLGMSFTRAT